VTRRLQWLYVLLTALLLSLVVGIAMTTATDALISDAIFAAGGNAWPLPHAGWTRAAGYEGPKYLLIVFAVVLLAGLIQPAVLRRLGLEPREAAYLLACLAIVPAMIGTLKHQSGVVCANQLLRYGGDIPDRLGHFMFARFLANDGLHGCFPSGHASGGFALLALGMLDRKVATRRVLWFIAVLYGSYMGTYQLLRGAHFLSHILVSALLAQLIVLVIARYMPLQRAATPTLRPSDWPVQRAQRRT